MKKLSEGNIFIKSFARQRLRFALLALLMAFSAFMFAVRLSECLYVVRQTGRIGSYYRAIGFVQKMNEEILFNNVLQAADIIKGSPHLAFEDRRRAVGGQLMGMKNADIGGMRGLDFDLYPMFNVGQIEFTDAFFYGKLVSLERGQNIERPAMVLRILVDDVALGYPEHAEAGQTLTMLYYLTEEEALARMEAELEGGGAVAETAVDGMRVGERYFLRGVFFRPNDFTKGLPQRGRDSDPLVMRSLNETTSLESGLRVMDEAPIWYVPADADAEDASSHPGLGMLDGELERLRANQSNMWIRTSVDMSAMPLAQAQHAFMLLSEGRWIVSSDNEHANPVAVIYEDFARIREVSVGDTLRVSIPKRQLGMQGAGIGFMPDIVMLGMPGGEDPIELELEVVGIFRFAHPTPGVTISMSSSDFNYVFVPDSVLPGGFSSDIFRNWKYMEYMDASEFLMDSWYSFVLRDARDAEAFMQENGDALMELGFRALFFENGAENFWLSADQILLASALNLAAFSALLVLVAAFISILHVRMRKKEYAIQRAMGLPSKTASSKLISAFALSSIPAAAIGGAVGWAYAAWSAGSAANPFGEFATASGIELGVSLPAWWCLAPIAAAAAIALAMAALLVARLSRQSVLEMLQGGVGRGGKRVA